MTSSADLGGKSGFGPVPGIDDNRPFHSEWEPKVLSLTLAMGAAGKWNIDQSRAARETLPPDEYLSLSYYEIWMTALENLLLKNGLVTADELKSGRNNENPVSDLRVLRAGDVAKVLNRGSSYERDVSSPARFAAGDRVRTVLQDHGGHTRLPRYLTGKTGIVEQAYGAFVFPDSSAAGAGDDPRWLYRVRFSKINAGSSPEAGTEVSADLWEPYLEHA